MKLTWHDARLVCFSLALGPPLGAVLFILGTTIITAVGFGSRDFSLVRLAINQFPMVLFFAYILASLPAMFSAVANCIIARREPNRVRRLVYAALAGAVPSALTVGLTGARDLGDTANALVPMLLFGVVGAICSVAMVLLAEARFRR